MRFKYEKIKKREENVFMMKASELLRGYFGYSSFRDRQEEIINNIIQGNDVMAIMPTGGGKSICYQIPALMMDGITIVISPLISLMKDQVDNIKELGIPSAYINSTLSNVEVSAVIEDVLDDKIKLLYVAPERLNSPDFCTLMRYINISMVAIDEAHCVSQWGHDFRTSYRYIDKFINSLISKPIVTAFTATATKEVQEDIVKLLQLNKPKVFISGFDRANLELKVIKSGNKNQFLLNYIEGNNDSSGIVYVATRKEVDRIYELLLSKGYSVARYHGGMKDEDRKQNQEDFVYDKVNIMVATNAFGMGIDKSNIRFVIHYNMPKNIEGYYQEIGRAGRDGEKSQCVLLFAPEDVHIQKYLIEISIEDPERKACQYKMLQDMVDYIYTNDCLRKYILNYFGEDYETSCNNCSNCNSEGELVDKTVDAQKVLSCIYRMKRPYGTNMITEVLRGSKNKKVLGSKFNEISTYGIMKEYSDNGLKEFINTLAAHRYLDVVEGEYPVLRLNENSMKILKNEIKVQFKEDKKVKKISDHNELFELLRTLRREISSREKLPPYMIFADTTLNEMSNKYPTTKEEILNVSGVGLVKYQRYGEEFIEVIKKYLLQNKVNN